MSNPNLNAIPNTSYSRTNVKTLTSLAMLSAIAYVVMLLSKMLPQVNGFLQLDLKDTIICMGGFLFGPMAAAAGSFLVPLLEMMFVSDTGIIGFIMNVLSTASFCCISAFMYKKFHTQPGAIISLLSGVLSMTAIMLVWNYLITPIYQGVPRDVVAAMLPTVFLPFNLVKGGLNMALTLVLYKPIVTALRKAHLVPQSPEETTSKKMLNIGFLLFSLLLLTTFGMLALVMMNII